MPRRATWVGGRGRGCSGVHERQRPKPRHMRGAAPLTLPEARCGAHLARTHARCWRLSRLVVRGRGVSGQPRVHASAAGSTKARAAPPTLLGRASAQPRRAATGAARAAAQLASTAAADRACSGAPRGSSSRQGARCGGHAAWGALQRSNGAQPRTPRRSSRGAARRGACARLLRRARAVAAVATQHA